MQINLEVAGQLIVIAVFVCGCFKYIVISPLQGAIEGLGKGVESLNKNLEKLQEQQHAIDKRLGVAEEQIKVANHRLSDLEEVVRK